MTVQHDVDLERPYAALFVLEFEEHVARDQVCIGREVLGTYRDIVVGPILPKILLLGSFQHPARGVSELSVIYLAGADKALDLQ